MDAIIFGYRPLLLYGTRLFDRSPESACELGYLPDEIYERMATYAESVGKQLDNYIAYLKRSKQGEKEMPAGYTICEESESYIFDNPDEESAD